MSEVWGEAVSVVLHHVSEDEGFEGGYEAETLSGAPNGIRISGADRMSKEAALDHLIGGLALLGFRGRLVIDDVTEVGRRNRSEVEVAGGIQ